MSRDRRPLADPSPDLVRQFAEIVGPVHALTDANAQAPYLVEWRDRYRGRTPVVLRPGTTLEVSRILALANEAHVAIVPQTGNTGLVGGQVPFEAGGEVVLSLARMNRIREIDASGTWMIAEAGVTLAAARAAAEARDRLFPLSMASEGSCCIGGNLATNAGGVAVLAYGSARHLALGLEVVLADGRVWSGLKALKKDNTGYDLRDLFIGSEGTLGVITAATLKLFPRPREQATAFVALHDLDQLAALFKHVEAGAGSALTAFEFMSEQALEFVARHVPGTRRPFAEAYPWYALIELSGAEEGPAMERLERLLGEALDHRMANAATIARSTTQARAFWRLRESISEAQKGEGGSIKHDISVAPPLIPEFLNRAGTLIETLCPGARPVPFGHFGDGNVHYNVTQPVGMDKAQFLAQWDAVSQAVHTLVVSMGGSIAAEHGIGRMKRGELARFKSAVELDMMRAVKSALDPNGILNPGKVL